MSCMLADYNGDTMYHPIALGILGLVVSALVNLVVPIITGIISTSFEKQYGRELPL